MRKYLRLGLALALVLGLGSVVALVAITMRHRPEIELLQKGLEILPGVSQHLQNFRRVKMTAAGLGSGGRRARLRCDQHGRRPRPSAVLVLGGRPAYGLEGTEGRVLLDKGDVARVELEGEIQVFLADYRVAADSAVYDRATDRITAPGVVEITGEALQLRGEGLEIQVKDQRLVLRKSLEVMQPALLRERHSKSRDYAGPSYGTAERPDG
jgi:hypothetical protein